MRLRYLHLSHYPPIHDMALRFASGSPLRRDCAIRFVVGVNGCGKSNLLRAVAEVFIALSEQRVPPFPVSLVYELGQRGSSSQRTLLLDCPGPQSQASLWVAERFAWPDDAETATFEAALAALHGHSPPAGFTPLIAPGLWPARAATAPLMALPQAVLAYTTGAIQPWQQLWSHRPEAEGAETLPQGEEYEPGNERPANWTLAQENAWQGSLGAADSEAEEDTRQSLFRRPMLLTPALLKCALLAVALPEALGFTPADSARRLRDSLQRGGWHQLMTVAFRCRLQPKTWRRNLCETAHDWLLFAGEAIAEPHPFELRRSLFFDLNGAFKPHDPTRFAGETQGAALLALLGGAEATRFELFIKLAELHQAGLFDDLELHLRRGAKAQQDIGVLRYQELSDGEQMVLGRMALFHLLENQQDSLLLLDEPETHFNDLWKRDIVSVVDEALGQTACEVMIATHAALVLTDALKEELIVLEKSGADGVSSLRHLDSDIHTFGATGDHPLRDIFGAPDTVGRRASRLLEVLLAAASVADSVEAYWRESGQLGEQELVARLLDIARQTEPDLTDRLVQDAFASIEHFALHFGCERPLQMVAVLEAFIRQTGPGYFQIELKRAWRRLKEKTDHAA